MNVAPALALLAALLLALWREIETKRTEEDGGPAVAFALGLGAVAVLLVLAAWAVPAAAAPRAHAPADAGRDVTLGWDGTAWVEVSSGHPATRVDPGDEDGDVTLYWNDGAWVKLPLGVEGDTLAASVMLSADNGCYRNSIKTFRTTGEAVVALKAGAVAAVMAQQGELEGGDLLFCSGVHLQ